MGLQFVLGKASAQHQTALVNKIMAWQQADPAATIYYLVPNHVKFASEVSVLQELQRRSGAADSIAANLAVQVFSLTRLAWHFMNNDYLYNLPRLTDAGTAMILQRILQDNAAQLQILQASKQQGFLHQLAGQLTEFAQSNVQPDDLAQLQAAATTPNNGDLALKLADLQLIYREFLAAVEGKYLKLPDILPALAQKLSQVDLSHSYFVLADFSSFTAQELTVVHSLMANAKEVAVALPLPHQPKAAPAKTDLLYRAERLYRQLINFARANGVKVYLNEYASPQPLPADLAALEDYWLAAYQGEPAPKPVAQTHVHLLKTDSRLGELRAVAGKIRTLVATKGYHYRDILVLARNLSNYRNLVHPVFSESAIPVFIDLDQQMSAHPLVDLLQAVIAVYTHNFRLADVVQVLKTELLVPPAMDVATFRHGVDLLENLALARNYQGKMWLDDTEWSLARPDAVVTTKIAEQNKLINQIKTMLKTTLQPLFTAWDTAADGRAAAVSLVEFLANSGVKDQLTAWAQADHEAGNIEAAGQPEQVWACLMDLLDQYVQNLGAMPFVVADFQEILTAGFAAATYSRVPATLDAVSISESKMVQPHTIKAVFILDATSTQMPHLPQPSALLTDNDRNVLNDLLGQSDSAVPQYLLDDSYAQLQNEPYLAYRAMLTATEEVYLSYAQMALDEAQELSPYVKTIWRHFGWHAEAISDQLTAQTPLTSQLLTTKPALVRAVLQQAQQAQLAHVLPQEDWFAVVKFLQNDARYNDLLTWLFKALTFQNLPTHLAAVTVKELYGNEFAASVSSLEDFFKNPYELFLRNGLRLKERAVFELNPLVKGTYYHAILDGIIKLLKEKRQTLDELSFSQMQKLLEQVIAATQQQSDFQVLTSSHRMEYMGAQLAQTLGQMLWTLKHHSKTTPLRPFQTEVQFGLGAGDSWRALHWRLPHARAVNLRGKIDRIDTHTVRRSDGVMQGFFDIIDYKSGVNRINFPNVLSGLQLQLLAYLRVALEHQTDLFEDDVNVIKPVGVLYSHITNPQIDGNGAVEETGAKANNFTGLWFADHEDTVKYFKPAKQYPFTLTKTDKFSGNTHGTLTPHQIGVLLEKNEALIKQAAQAILTGDVSLLPFRYDTVTGLQNSPFLDVFQFDALMGNEYREIPDVNYKDLLKDLDNTVLTNPQISQWVATWQNQPK